MSVTGGLGWGPLVAATASDLEIALAEDVDVFAIVSADPDRGQVVVAIPADTPPAKVGHLIDVAATYWRLVLDGADVALLVPGFGRWSRDEMNGRAGRN